MHEYSKTFWYSLCCLQRTADCCRSMLCPPLPPPPPQMTCLKTTHVIVAVLQGMSYWVRLPTSGPLGSDSDQNPVSASADESAKQQLSLTRPIVFLHGVGLGLVSILSTCFCLSIHTLMYPAQLLLAVFCTLTALPCAALPCPASCYPALEGCDRLAWLLLCLSCCVPCPRLIAIVLLLLLGLPVCLPARMLVCYKVFKSSPISRDLSHRQTLVC